MDAYLALTPLLVLGIIGLICFIGCNWLYGLDETKLKVDPVGDLMPTAGNNRVHLTWSYPSSASVTGFRIDVTGGTFDAVPPLGAAARFTDVTGLTNGTTYTFAVVAERGSDASDPVTVSATPGITSFVIDDPPISGMSRNDYGGWVGIEIMVGPNPIIVTQLGRIVAATNSGVHEVKIVTPVTTPSGPPVAGVDVVSASVTTVAKLDQSNVGKFEWATLPQAVTLQPNKIYFVVSAEIDGGDLWFEQQPLPTTGVAALLYSTYTFTTGPDAGKYVTGMQATGFVPVSFRY